MSFWVIWVVCYIISLSSLSILNISSLKSWPEILCSWLVLVGSTELTSSDTKYHGVVCSVPIVNTVEWYYYFVLWYSSLTRMKPKANPSGLTCISQIQIGMFPLKKLCHNWLTAASSGFMYFILIEIGAFWIKILATAYGRSFRLTQLDWVQTLKTKLMLCQQLQAK